MKVKWKYYCHYKRMKLNELLPRIKKPLLILAKKTIKESWTLLSHNFPNWIKHRAIKTRLIHPHFSSTFASSTFRNWNVFFCQLQQLIWYFKKNSTYLFVHEGTHDSYQNKQLTVDICSHSRFTNRNIERPNELQKMKQNRN